MRLLPAGVLILVVTTAASAQVQSRPTDAPTVTAEHESWYLQGDSVQFAGQTYRRAGAAVFFDGNRMVRAGNFNGVPLYADTTAEPFSLVYVPVGRGLMQPFERPRSGDLAGTVGSRAPSFPVSAQPNGSSMPMAAGAPTGLVPIPLDEVPTEPVPGTPRIRVDASHEPAGDAVPAPAPVPPSRPAATPAEIQAARNRVWVDFRGQKWTPAGAAIPLAGSDLVKAGEISGFPVYVSRTDSAGTRIYLPALGGLVTPYALKP